MEYCSFCPRGNHECYGFKSGKVNPIVLTIKKAESDLLDAIQQLYRENYDLIEREVNERCITNYLFHYFLELKSEEYPNYNIDAEYNKNGDRKKVYSDDDESGIPDLLIHRRRCNRENLLCVEFKKNKLGDTDIHKLICFTKPHASDVRKNTDLEYSFGCGVELKSDEVRFHWYENGRRTRVCKYKYDKNEMIFIVS